ncbi:MAG: hypothetical protein JSW52_02225 [Candidatus Coatesbacteria bacterium]|nr:MAG: hypothetical protein JSW52_02225 [Candidatus Coatesbacteria bacterium]
MQIYVEMSGEKSGPFALEQLSEWIRLGRLRQGDYLIVGGESVLLKPEHIPELTALLEEEKGGTQRGNFRKWLTKTIAFSTSPPSKTDDELASLREENERLTARLAELEEEVEHIKRSDVEREEELRGILERKTAVDRERRKLESVRERLERRERRTARRSRVPVYAAVAAVFSVVVVAVPLWYIGVYRPSKEAKETASRAAEKYEKANETLTEVLYLHDEVQVLYEKLNRLNNRFAEERALADELEAAEIAETSADVERISARVDEMVPGSVSLDVLVLPSWPAGDDPARAGGVLEAKLRPRRNLVLSAYGTALVEDPEIRGYVLVSAEIGRDGFVDDVDIKKTTIDAPLLHDACKKTFELTNFGKAESDTTCLFKFAFEPEG